MEAPRPIRAICANGKVKSITFTNVPSLVALSNVTVDVPELGPVTVDVILWGGY